MAATGASLTTATWAEVAQRAVAPCPNNVARTTEEGNDGVAGEEDASDPMLEDSCLEDDQQYPYEQGSEADELDDDFGDDPRDNADEEGDMGGGQAMSEDELRRAWEDAKETVKLLEGNPRSPPALVATARRQRDRAESAWRAAKRPHPLHKRLRWAQRAYDGAVGKQQVHQE